ncbi:unnamed protein product [Echinostoma caproni]|uniref:Uncharacterized protein n=1 Tax=Echinostoma caproni TaxID=27848 RepID=A0A183AF18_9TREM|nr:unnamed protein product [Echinostoma caproni]
MWVEYCQIARAKARLRIMASHVILLVFELLRDIWHDHARLLWRDPKLFHTYAGSGSAETHPYIGSEDLSNRNSPCVTDPKHLIVARLNVLVLLSKRVFLRLEEQRIFYEPVLGAIYQICLDLSYGPEESKESRSVTSPHSRLAPQRTVGLRSTRFRGVRTDSHEPSQSPAVSDSSQTSALAKSSFASRATRIHPRMRASCLSTPLSGPRNPRDDIDRAADTTPSPPGCLTSSSLVSSVGERQLFLRLAYHLVRVAPQLFPCSLVQAVAAPCLRAGRFQTVGDFGTGGADLLGQPRDRSPVRVALRPVLGPAPCIPPRNITTGYDQICTQSDSGANPITSDVALRTCLLILAELGE